MLNINKIKEYKKNFNKFLSPVDEDMNWLAEYKNDTYLSEYDFDIKKKNTFEMINKNDLKSFGIIGEGFYFRFLNDNGLFQIISEENENMDIIVSYFDIENDIEYNLMQYSNDYRTGLIMYRQAEEFLNSNQGIISNIIGYGLGYKTIIENINFRAILHIERDDAPYFTFRLVSNKNIKGEFRIYKNNVMCACIKEQLEINKNKTFKWYLT